MSLKICQVCAVDFTLKHFLLPLIDGMQAKEWQVTSVCSDGEYVADLRKDGYRIFTIDIRRNFNLLSHGRALWKMYQLFRRERFDMVHVHTPVAALIGRFAAKLAGVRCVVYTAHGFYFHDQMVRWKRSAHILLERVGGCLTDLLFTQSEEDAASAVLFKIASKDKVFAIGNGVDINRFSPDSFVDRALIRKALAIPNNAFVVGIIGRFVREKGYFEFLAAALELAEGYADVYFLLVGDRLPSDHADSIDAALGEARQSIGHRLILTGFRSDTPQLLEAMDVFCLPSYREGMPRTIIEAMMMGKPVVATDIRGSREEVIDGETGFLVATKSKSALVVSLKKLIEQPDLGKNLGRAGRLRALRLYDERLVVERQVQILSNHVAPIK